MRPKSPVVSHPSASRTARVASLSKTPPPMPAPVGGPPQYPRRIAAECTRTRPTSPGTTGAPTSSVTSSDTPGTGRPTVVATASSGSPGTVPVPSDASVDVYRTATGTPNVARRDATNSGGTRDAPVPTIRRDDTSASASSGLASTRAHWVGTPCPTVIRSAAMIDTVSAARHGVGVLTVVMALAASPRTRVIDPTWANGRGDRRRSPLPFAHVGSMTRVWDEAANAITTVITPTPWRAADTVSIMAAERITVGQGVPTQWALVLARPELADADVSSLRIVGTGASRVPPELVASLRATFGVPVAVRYTSTEASLGTGTVPGDPDEAVATTVGRPVPGVSLEVTDDVGAPVVPGEVGRVRVHSAAIMRGYWGGLPTGAGMGGGVFDKEATRAVLDADGWLTTGDFGRIDDDGRLQLVGRANELYIRGGYNVYPVEVEGVLGDHPDIAQIAVVGAPDPVLGETGVAFVVPAAGADVDADALLTALRETASASLADYKAPDRVIVVDDLPLTSMMKVDKRVLADRAALDANGARQR